MDLTDSTGAKKAREVIFTVLRDACINEDLSVPESIQAVKDIFSENARNLYKIKAVSKSFDSNDDASLSVKLDSKTSAQAVAFVRIIWVDASGQHRCRVSLLLQVSYFDVSHHKVLRSIYENCPASNCHLCHDKVE